MNEITRFDVSDYLDNDELIAEYLSNILEEGDTGLLLEAIGDVAKARGMTKIAESAGLGRESLYKAFSKDAKPRFETIFKVLQSLGITIHFQTKSKAVV